MLQDALSFAAQTAKDAGKIALRYFRTDLAVDGKADASPVTRADKECEAFIRAALTKRFPEHGIIGEEYGTENDTADFVWVIDPIDGTKSFIAGVPLFGMLIALLHNGRPVLGVVYQPFTGEMWTAADGIPTTLNGTPVHTRTKPLADATLMTTDTDLFNGSEKDAFFRLKNATKYLRQSADCYAYALLATGCVDIVCEAGMKLHDFAALVPVIENAGGVVTDWSGAPVTAASDGCVLACGCPETHAQALRLLA